MAKFGKIENPFTEIEYVDTRPIFIPVLTAYKKGITPKTGEVIKVTANEKIKLLNQKNGKNPCWKVVQNKKVEVEKTFDKEVS